MSKVNLHVGTGTGNRTPAPSAKIKDREEIVSLPGLIECERERKTQSKKPFGQPLPCSRPWPPSSRVRGPTPLDPVPALKTKAMFRTERNKFDSCKRRIIWRCKNQRLENTHQLLTQISA